MKPFYAILGRKLKVILATAFLITVMATIATAQYYTVTDIGPISPGNIGTGGINNFG